jgi:hypothetical protein
VAIAVERCLRTGVPHPGLDEPHIGSTVDQQGRHRALLIALSNVQGVSCPCTSATYRSSGGHLFSWPLPFWTRTSHGKSPYHDDYLPVPALMPPKTSSEDCRLGRATRGALLLSDTSSPIQAEEAVGKRLKRKSFATTCSTSGEEEAESLALGQTPGALDGDRVGQAARREVRRTSTTPESSSTERRNIERGHRPTLAASHIRIARRRDKWP